MAETYPSTADYITAIRRMDAFVLDPVLKTGIPRCIDDVSVDRGGEPLLYSGGFAKVFVIDKAGKTYAFRCWTMDIGSTAQHYDAVGDYLRRLRSAYFADFEFLPDGILVKGRRYPTLRMEWIEAGSLRDFLGAHVGQREVLTAAAENFQQMTRFLQDQRIAHGDLQSDNIKMQRDGADVRFRLIDYDTLFVPALDGTRVTNVGLPSYQHPSRHVSKHISPKDDYFSNLVIYLTLHALAEDPLLWRDYKIENRDKAGLLFGAEDFRSETPSELFQRLRRLSPFVSNLALALWNFSRCPSIELLIPLHSVMEVCRASPAGGAGNFDALLRNKMPQRGGNGWLQEWTPPVATVHLAKRPSRAAAPPVIAPVPSQPTSFDLLLQKGRYAAQPTSPSATPPIQPSQGAPTPSATTGNWKVLFWIIVVIIILCLLMKNCMANFDDLQTQTKHWSRCAHQSQRSTSRNVSGASIEWMFCCHCRDCQQASGGPYSPAVLVPSKAFKLTRGSPRYYTTPSAAGGTHTRGFCADCGSRLLGAVDPASPFIGICASSLDAVAAKDALVDISPD